MSSFGAGAVKAKLAGTTEGQRRRDFRNKAIMTAAQAALTLGRGVAGAAESSSLQSKQADDRLRSSAEKYKAPEYQGRTDGAPAWLGQGGEGDAGSLPHEGMLSHDTSLGQREDPYSPIGKPAQLSTDAAKATLDAQAGNQSAVDAPVNGLYTAQGLDAQNEQKAQDERNMALGTGMMRSRSAVGMDGLGIGGYR